MFDGSLYYYIGSSRASQLGPCWRVHAIMDIYQGTNTIFSFSTFFLLYIKQTFIHLKEDKNVDQ